MAEIGTQIIGLIFLVCGLFWMICLGVIPWFVHNIKLSIEHKFFTMLALLVGSIVTLFGMGILDWI